MYVSTETLSLRRIICDTRPPQFLLRDLHLQSSQCACPPVPGGRQRCVTHVNVSQQGVEASRVFITQVEANCCTVHIIVCGTHEEPRGVVPYVSSISANVQLLHSASGVLHDCSSKRSYLTLYITLSAAGQTCLPSSFFKFFLFWPVTQIKLILTLIFVLSARCVQRLFISPLSTQEFSFLWEQTKYFNVSWSANNTRSIGSNSRG